jgi:hypothetical protein
MNMIKFCVPEVYFTYNQKCTLKIRKRWRIQQEIDKNFGLYGFPGRNPHFSLSNLVFREEC